MTNAEWIRSELGALYGGEVLRELGEINHLYALYDGGALSAPEDGEGARPGVNLIKKLIKEESRFMAGRAPELRIFPDKGDPKAASEIERFISRTLAENRWQKRLIHGVRDCLIGKRVALCLDGAPGRALSVRFVPSTEFVFEPNEAGDVAKIIFFYGLNDRFERSHQRIYRKKLWIPDDEEAERERDLDEVARGARSRLGFIRKWQPDTDAPGEMRQIEAEKRALGAME